METESGDSLTSSAKKQDIPTILDCPAEISAEWRKIVPIGLRDREFFVAKFTADLELCRPLQEASLVSRVGLDASHQD